MFVISLGGSLIFPEDIDMTFLKSFKKLILNQKGKFVIVCGGGKLARKCQEYAKKHGVKDNEKLDWIGISATRQNAQVVKELFEEKSFSEIIIDPRKKVKTNKKIIVGAGWKPGWSTDFDAVLLAKSYKSNYVINLSNIDYVYDKDPKLKGAKPIKNIGWEEFNKKFGTNWKPGFQAPFDPVASKMAQKLGIKVIIANGHNLKNLSNILSKKPFIGTLIK